MPRGGRPHAGLHEGREGWLFWLGADGQFVELWRDGIVARWALFRWSRRLAHRARRAERLGARFLQLFAPDKLTLYADMADLPRLDPACSFARRMGQRSPHVVDLVAPLAALRAKGVQAVFRTDSHWTEAGYLVVYRTLCAALGAAPSPAVLQGSSAGAPVAWSGDLGSKLDPPRLEARATRTFDRRARRIEANAVILHGEAQGHPFGVDLHLWSRQVLANDAEAVDPRRLVLFGDSYTFDVHGIGAMLAETFREVHMCWSPLVDWSYVARIRPDVVICETAERWVRLTRADGVDVDARGAAKIAALKAGRPVHDRP